ncbi:hypothetical protein P4O66_002039 [Electrophorus voltai]|uniref:Uncharacterized protein n=1 Tax=Electrophorus voltai TaxID=2609070 RepID=A0AAD9DTF8_9TELE|nr:hypothetical protein P4O66_002039 [Electrophorus voltai]
MSEPAPPVSRHCTVSSQHCHSSRRKQGLGGNMDYEDMALPSSGSRDLASMCASTLFDLRGSLPYLPQLVGSEITLQRDTPLGISRYQCFCLHVVVGGGVKGEEPKEGKICQVRRDALRPHNAVHLPLQTGQERDFTTHWHVPDTVPPQSRGSVTLQEGAQVRRPLAGGACYSLGSCFAGEEVEGDAATHTVAAAINRVHQRFPLLAWTPASGPREPPVPTRYSGGGEGRANGWVEWEEIPQMFAGHPATVQRKGWTEKEIPMYVPFHCGPFLFVHTLVFGVIPLALERSLPSLSPSLGRCLMLRAGDFPTKTCQAFLKSRLHSEPTSADPEIAVSEVEHVTHMQTRTHVQTGTQRQADETCFPLYESFSAVIKDCDYDVKSFKTSALIITQLPGKKSTEHSTMDSEDKQRVLLLQGEIKSLSEELVQCQADKEFVWSLWKRLQVANPDLTQAVSLVVEREKQKAEAKDRKVLEILQAKDYKIQALEQVLWHLLRMHQAVVAQELKEVTSQRKTLGDLTQQQRDSEEERAVMKKELAVLRRKLGNTTRQMQEREEEWGHVRSDLEESRRVLEEQCSGLQGALQRAQEQQEESRRQEAISSTNVKELQEEVVKTRAVLLETQGRCAALSSQLSAVEQLASERERQLQQISRELQELQGLYTQSVQHAGEQAELIQQLEGLNLDTQEVLHSQEQAHCTHTASYQQLYTELSVSHQALRCSEDNLRQRETVLSAQLHQRDHHISQLQAELQQLRERMCQAEAACLQAPPPQPQAPPPQPQLFEQVPRPAEEQQQYDVLDQPVRPRVPVPQDEEVAMGCEPPAGPPLSSSFSGTQGSGATRLSHQRSRSLSPVSRVAERKIQQLEELLALKTEENEELREAHAKRHDRLLLIQTNYRAVKDQLRDMEGLQGVCKGGRRRAEPWQLRQENSDAVWNELSYFKRQNKKLLAEKVSTDPLSSRSSAPWVESPGRQGKRPVIRRGRRDDSIRYAGDGYTSASTCMSPQFAQPTVHHLASGTTSVCFITNLSGVGGGRRAGSLRYTRAHLEEELDLTRVQAAMDRTTSHELRMCLQEEQQELQRREDEEKRTTKANTLALPSAQRLEQSVQKIEVLERKMVCLERETAHLQEDNQALQEANHLLSQDRDALQTALKRATAREEAAQAWASAERERLLGEAQALEAQVQSSRKEAGEAMGAETQARRTVLRLRQELGVLRAERDFHRALSHRRGKVPSASGRARLPATRPSQTHTRLEHRATHTCTEHHVTHSPAKDEWEDVSPDRCDVKVRISQTVWRVALPHGINAPLLNQRTVNPCLVLPEVLSDPLLDPRFSSVFAITAGSPPSDSPAPLCSCHTKELPDDSVIKPEERERVIKTF